MCGNGIRCLGRFLLDEGLCHKTPMTIETNAGIKTLAFEPDGQITVDMGMPCFDPREIPVSSPANTITLPLNGREATFFCVSMGNPHAVTFDAFPDQEAFLQLGPALENHPIFPRRANIEFCRVAQDGGVDVKVWERGAGPTLACGTGACAVLAAGASLGLIERDSIIHLPGGDLRVRWTQDGHLMMTGPAETICHGEI